MKTRDIDFGERRSANLQPEEELKTEEERALREHMTGFRFSMKTPSVLQNGDKEASLTLSAKHDSIVRCFKTSNKHRNVL